MFPLRSDFDTLDIDVDNVKEFADNCLDAQNLINLDTKLNFSKLTMLFGSWVKKLLQMKKIQWAFYTS